MEGLLLKYKSIHPLVTLPNSTKKEEIADATTSDKAPDTAGVTELIHQIQMQQELDDAGLNTTIMAFNTTASTDASTLYNITGNITDNMVANISTDLSGNLSGLLWNGEDFSWDDSWLTGSGNGSNLTDGGGIYNFSDFDSMNSTTPYGFWFCAQWTAAQQDLFQTAHIFIAMAFLVPHSFKRSILLVRALLSLGFLIAALWAGSDICAPDVMIWNFTLMLVNVVHAILLIVRFIPPTMSVELADLYLRLFKPLRVSKKHFSELTRDARVLLLEAGEPYALEEVSPADERLSILLRGKLKVSCDGTHLHYINPHQFIDSPEWEANHEHSDDVFQVSIMAEEDCYYLCWPRMKLERVLRHRPCLKVVLDSIIGKDITGKLYSLNEHLGLKANKGSTSGREDNEQTANAALFRSISVDAVYTGTRGRVRSDDWKAQERRDSFPVSDKTSPAHHWFPYVARHFPEHFPFPQSRAAALPPYPAVAPPPYASASPPVYRSHIGSSDPPLVPILAPPPAAPRPQRRVREVKFAEPKDIHILRRTDQPV